MFEEQERWKPQMSSEQPYAHASALTCWMPSLLREMRKMPQIPSRNAGAEMTAEAKNP